MSTPNAQVAAAMAEISETLAGLLDEGEWSAIEPKIAVVCAELEKAAASSRLTERQRVYLDQAQSELEDRALGQYEKGNDSIAKGCEASAFVIREMLATEAPSLYEQRKAQGYAPGGYMCKCAACENMFQGDKRAWTCESCADKSIATLPRLIRPLVPAEIQGKRVR